VIALVQVPAVSPTSDTTLYVNYGNASAADQQSITGTWDSNYKGVWHLPNGATLAGNDSTFNANNGAISGSTTATSGQVDGAASFAGTTNAIDTGRAPRRSLPSHSRIPMG